MNRKRMIVSLGARLSLLAGFLAGIVAYNQYPILNQMTGIFGVLLFPVIGASIGYLIGRVLYPPKRDQADLVEETFE